ncbi:MAG: ATP-binding cassette domain-containing protein, partial [Acidimicrobiales bacterium]|nr:ATP-binding cassette domain-containing protein [Acidimicrobiales bacterium]
VEDQKGAGLLQRVSRPLAPGSWSKLPYGFGPATSAIAVTVIGLAVLFALRGDYYDSMFVLSICYAIVVLGMVVQIGYSHQLAFSQSVFMMVGAYGVAVLNSKYQWSVPLSMFLMVVASILLSFVMGYFITKVPGFALALATLFFSVIVSGYVIYNNYLGGSTGLGGVGAIWTGGSFASTLERSGSIGIVLLGLAWYVCARIMKSGIGLELALMGQNEPMASAVGIITRRRKLELFVLGSALAALGGTIFAGTQAFVSSVSFNQTAEFTLLIMLFIGGRAALLGGLIGAIGIQYLQGTNNWIASHLLIIEGVLFTLILLYAPEGVIGLVRRAGSFLQSTLLRRVGLAPTPELASAPAAAIASAPGAPAAAPATQGASGDHQDVFGAADSAAPVGLEATPAAAPRQGVLGVVGGPGTVGPDDPPALECRDLSKRFGGVLAVDSVSLSVRGLGVHGVCGPNGAGKSTFFELVSGGLRSDGGEVFINGVNATRLLAYQRAQLGIARTLQAVRLMNNRTVLDNVAVAALPSHRTFMTHAVFNSELRGAYERARETIEQLGIGHMLMLRPGQLTLEAQRMVELARALVVNPRILLLDEPASGLSVDQRNRLAETLQELGKRMTIVLVEHDLQLVARIAEEIFVLIDGRLEFEGDAEAFMRSPVVRSELMGLIEEEELLRLADAETS